METWCLLEVDHHGNEITVMKDLKNGVKIENHKHNCMMSVAGPIEQNQYFDTGF